MRLFVARSFFFTLSLSFSLLRPPFSALRSFAPSQLVFSSSFPPSFIDFPISTSNADFSLLTQEATSLLFGFLDRPTRLSFSLTSKQNNKSYNFASTNIRISKWEIAEAAAEAGNIPLIRTLGRETVENVANPWTVAGALRGNKANLLRYFQEKLGVKYVALKDGGFPEGEGLPYIDVKTVAVHMLRYSHFDPAKKLLSSLDKLFDGRFFLELIEFSIEGGDLESLKFLLDQCQKKTVKPPKGTKAPDDFDPIKKAFKYSIFLSKAKIFTYLANTYPEEVVNTSALCDLLPDLFRCNQKTADGGAEEIAKVLINRNKEFSFPDLWWDLLCSRANVEIVKFLVEKKNLKAPNEAFEAAVRSDQTAVLSYLLEKFPKVADRQKLFGLAIASNSTFCYIYLKDMGCDWEDADFLTAMKTYVREGRPSSPLLSLPGTKYFSFSILRHMAKLNCPKDNAEVIVLAVSYLPDTAPFEFLLKAAAVPKGKETSAVIMKACPPSHPHHKLLLEVISKYSKKA